MEFKKVKLGEIGKIVGGGTPKTKEELYYGGEIAWITPKDLSLNKSKYIFYGERNITEEGLKNSSAKLLPKGTVLFSSRAPIGYVAIAGNDLATNQGFKSVIPAENVDSEFIYYLLINNVENIKNFGVGSTFREVSGSVMKNIEIMIPDFSIQRKIAKILNTLDSKIEINNKIISNLESQAQAIFKSWFVDFEPFQDGDFVESELGMIPEGWEVRELKDVSKRINGFSYTSKDIFDESDINMITIKNFDRNGGLQNDSIKPISKNSRIKKDHYLKTNDILMACTDLTQKADIIGGVLLYFENENFDNEIFSMDLIKLVPFEKDDTFFFYYYLKNPIFKLFAENASSGTTVLHLSKKAVDNFNIVYPIKKHIDRFNDYVFPIIKKQRNLLTQNTKLAELRDALLPKLMAGEIDVSNIKIEGEEVKNE